MQNEFVKKEQKIIIKLKKYGTLLFNHVLT